MNGMHHTKTDKTKSFKETKKEVNIQIHKIR